MKHNLVENYKEIKLEYGYSLRQNDKYNVIFKENKPLNILDSNATNIYNTIFDFKPRLKSIKIEKEKISIDFLIETKKFKQFDFRNFSIQIGSVEYEFFKKSENTFHLDIPYNTISISGNSEGIYLNFKDNNGFYFKRKFLSKTGPHKNNDHELFYSKIKNYNNKSIFVYETWRGFISIAYRKINYTDSFKEQKKIRLAFLKHKLNEKLSKASPSILIFEKFCEKYEESGKCIFERLIDDGWKNVYFILDENSEYFKKVPKKYKKNIIKKYSFKHYYEYFNAISFLSTESMNHAIELSNYNQLIRRRQMWRDYYFFFLQHGVMYGYSLKGRYDFEKGGGFGDNSFIVVSSQKEAEHFIEDGKFDRNDLIKSGLPKFDNAIKYDDADRITIMPTSRNFEYSIIQNDAKNSSSYKFSKKIIEIIPDELKDKVIFLPHPLVKDAFSKTDLKEFICDISYDEILKNTRLLITDYSSISFDAFYRGSNIIFAWMDKELCLNKLGIEIKLNEDNIFGDIAYDYENLNELISKNYYSKQNNENKEKFMEIVEFHDGKNTDRFIEYIYDTNLFPKKANNYNINDAIIFGIEDKAYTGKKIGLANLKVLMNGKKLIRNLDYIVRQKNNKEIGTATVDIIAKGIYQGKKTMSYEIKRNIKNCDLKTDTEKLNVNDGEKILSENKDFTIENIEYTDLGIKKIIITGIGEYLGKKEILTKI